MCKYYSVNLLKFDYFFSYFLDHFDFFLLLAFNFKVRNHFKKMNPIIMAYNNLIMYSITVYFIVRLY